MSGLFGVIAKKDCRNLLFYGTDYHSHLGTEKAGLAMINHRLQRCIHDISTSQFKSKFLEEIMKMKGTKGIGVISDSDPQPIIISSSFGNFALAASGLLANKEKLAKEIMSRGGSFSEMSGGKINSVEVIGKFIAQKENIIEGIEYIFTKFEGSISLLALTKEGLWAARDPLGRTTLVVGQKGEALAVASESSAFPNLGFKFIKELAAGEIVLLSKKGLETKKQILRGGKICAFLWIYTGYPASCYEGISVEQVRENCGANLAKGDKKIKADFVTGIPDSGIAHALGYAMAAKIPYRRPLVKYTTGYDRSYTPPSQAIRDQIAKMKLIPIKEIINGKRIVICDDSIVRGTQLKNQAIEKLWRHGAKEIHVRIACPPLMFPCKYNLSTRTRKELAARKAIKKLGKDKSIKLKKFIDETTPQYREMVEEIKKELGVNSLKYQTVKQMVKAIGLPKKKICLYCWTGEE
jgi:amidophosphoribosyltransferase